MARILIAEDERDIRDLVDFTLKFAGHEVVKVANGAEAVEKAPEVMPDLILMDVRMPRMTGYEACRALKEMDSVAAIPVVFLSAKGQDVEMKAGLEAGAIDYILKPFAPDELTRRVNEILEKIAQTPPPAAKPPQSEPEPEHEAELPPAEPEAEIPGNAVEEPDEPAVEEDFFGQVAADPESLETVRIDQTTAMEAEQDPGPESDSIVEGDDETWSDSR